MRFVLHLTGVLAVLGLAQAAHATFTFDTMEVSRGWPGSNQNSLALAPDGTVGLAVSPASGIESGGALGGVDTHFFDYDGTNLTARGSIDRTLDGNSADYRGGRVFYYGTSNTAQFAGYREGGGRNAAVTTVSSGGTIVSTANQGVGVDGWGHGSYGVVTQAKGRSGDPYVYVYETTDSGANWSGTQIYQNARGWSPKASRVVADAAGAYMVFDHEDGNGLYYSDSPNGWETGTWDGSTWTGNLVQVDSGWGGGFYTADIARIGTASYVAYVHNDVAIGGGQFASALKVRSMADGDSSFGNESVLFSWAQKLSDQGISNDFNWFDLQMVEHNGKLALIWLDRSANEIKLTYGLDNDWQTQVLTGGVNSGEQWHSPAVTSDGENLYVAYSLRTLDGDSTNGDPDITYFAVGAIPEPASMMLLGAGSLLLVARRRSQA